MASPDTNRNVSNPIRSGTIAEVDLAAAQCRVHTGDLQTDWLPWLLPAAGALIIWAAPTVGEQVVVLSPDGDTMGGVVLRGLYSDAFAPPETAEGVTLVQFGDGAKLRYSDQAHELLAELPSGGKATITADGGLTINGPLKINGDVTVEGDQRLSGKLTADADVLGGGVSLKTHKTKGVTPGSGMSGLPQ